MEVTACDGISHPSSRYGVGGVIGTVIGTAAAAAASALTADAAVTSSAVTVPLGPEALRSDHCKPASRISFCTVGDALSAIVAATQSTIRNRGHSSDYCGAHTERNVASTAERGACANLALLAYKAHAARRVRGARAYTSTGWPPTCSPA